MKFDIKLEILHEFQSICLDPQGWLIRTVIWA